MPAPVLPLLLALGAAAPQGTDREVRVELLGARLVLEDGVLSRARRDGAEPLDCTDPEGPGRVRDIAADPAGLTFVAAERGLYVVGPFVDHLDPLWLRQGAPQGAPTSVHVDDSRRVWVATEESVGVVDPSFFWGRTLDVGDLAPPYAIAARGTELVVTGADGEIVVEVDAAPPPTVTSVTVDGAEVARGARAAARYGVAPALGATGDAHGGATFRYRVDRHHVWRALDDDSALRRMDPGVRRVEVVAIDAHLRLSEPFTVEVDVAMPRVYGKGFVLTALALTALAVLALAVVVQPRGRSLVLRLRDGVATTAVVLVVGLQVLAGIVPHAKGWPFVGYSMYSKSFDPDAPVHRPILVARRANGPERELPPAIIGGAIDSRWQVLGPLATGGPEVSRAALERLDERLPKATLDVIQVQSRRTRLTDRGPIPIAPLVLSHYERPRDEGNGAGEGGR